GSTIIGDANRDFISLTLDTLADDYQHGIELLAETLMAPAFNRDDFLRLQKQQLDELVSERQAPARLASLVGLRAVLGERLGNPVSGGEKSVSKLTLADVRAWYQTYVYPGAVSLCVVGPVDPSQVQLAAEAALARLKGKRPAIEQPQQSPTPESTRIYVLDRPGSVQSAIFVAQPFPKRQEAGYAARQLLDNVLGGQFTSRINQNLRERHAYTYGAHSTAIATRYFGLMTVSTSVRTEVTVPAVQEIIQELREIRGSSPQRPIASDELQRARAGLVQRLGAHLEDSHRLIDDYEQLFVYGLAPNYLESYLTETRQLPSAALATEASRLDPDRLIITMVGDAASLREQLERVHWQALPVPPEWVD
ncbi:MAG TPA: pitrilysin family protein, partial [Polyangiaceae bacterium]